MERREKKRRILIGGAVFCVIVIGICCYQRVKMVSKKMVALEVQTEMEQLKVATNIITSMQLKSGAGAEEIAVLQEVEYKTVAEAVMNPYKIPIRGEDISLSLCCEAKEDTKGNIALKLYAFKMDYDSVKKAVENPVISMKSNHGILRLKEYLNASDMLYLVEISYKEAESYFSFELE